MTDIWPEAKRSEVMSLIRSKDTKPETVVRSMLHRMGHRFRLHRRDLPGHPDIVLPKHRVVIFVNGCFWHSHKNCRDGKMPRSNQDYWRPKLERTVRRDAESVAALQRDGWKTLVIWECEVRKSLPELPVRVQFFLDSCVGRSRKKRMSPVGGFEKTDKLRARGRKAPQ